MAINRTFFFDHVRNTLFGKKLRQDQVTAMEAILDHWEGQHADEDDRWLAYLLGTTFHETDRKMFPIDEYGDDAYFNRSYGPDTVVGRSLGNTEEGDGARFHGRGFVQLTGRHNYASWSRRLGIDLLADPTGVKDMGIAAHILIEGAILGNFTGKRLADYFSPTKEDWVNARRIINRLDKAHNIAGYAKQFYAAISHTV